MGAYVVSFVLLLVMVALIARPFLTEPAPAGAPSGALDRDSHEVVPAAAQAATAAAAAPPVEAPGSADAPPAVPEAAAAGSTEDALRAQVEAAIAARKVALNAATCTSCGAAIERSDAFCRSCGGAQAAGAS